MGATLISATQNSAITNYDYSLLMLSEFKTISGTYTNASGGEVSLLPGMIFGRVHATGLLAICDNDGGSVTAGNDIPLGINLTTATVANGASETVSLAVTGIVDASKLVFISGDDLETVYSGRQLRDLIPASTEGISLKNVESLVNFDNV